MSKTNAAAFSFLFAALMFAAPQANAQFPALPPLPGQGSAPQLPKRDSAMEVTKMTKRYGLSEEQASKIRTILDDHAQKIEAIVKDDSLPPPALAAKLRAAREDEIKLVSDVMTPEQREKYETDVHPSGHPRLPFDESAPEATGKK